MRGVSFSGRESDVRRDKVNESWWGLSMGWRDGMEKVGLMKQLFRLPGVVR